MLRKFTGETDDFENRRQQVEMLRNTFELDDNAAKVLINLRLKGKALRWCHSKPNHLALSATELLEVMKSSIIDRESSRYEEKWKPEHGGKTRPFVTITSRN